MTPPAEVHVDEALVRTLLQQQLPDLADLPIQPLAHGWDNQLFRVGTQHIARLPRRAAGASLLLNEQRWLPVLGPALPLPTPWDHRVGAPGAGYPWSWSVVPYLEGTAAASGPLPVADGPRLGAFLAALHTQPVPPDPPHNPHRGVPLQLRSEGFEERLRSLAARGVRLPLEHVRDTFQQALQAPIDETPRWLHGDLHPKNLLVHDGHLAGVVDWGDLTVGDRATDLASAWLAFDGVVPRGFWQAAGDPSEATLSRAQGWAAVFGAILLDVGLAEGDAHFERIGRTTLTHLSDRSHNVSSVPRSAR